MTSRFASFGRGGPSGPGRCDVYAAGTIELFFYGELEEAQCESVERHVRACASCREALQELGDIRAALAARPDVSAPPSGDWSGFMSRLDAQIERAGETHVIPFVAPAPRVHRYAAWAAMAALLALVTMSVVFVARTREKATAVTAVSQPADITPPAPAGATSLAALSEQHFERSKLVVLGLAAKDAAHATGADWAYERNLASSLLADTRLYRMAAEEHGMTAVADVMRDLETVLLQASLSDQADAATLGQIQRLIRKRDLLTKMNVVTTRGL